MYNKKEVRFEIRVHTKLINKNNINNINSQVESIQEHLQILVNQNSHIQSRKKYQKSWLFIKNFLLAKMYRVFEALIYN